jgi:hypothetical protein
MARSWLHRTAVAALLALLLPTACGTAADGPQDGPQAGSAPTADAGGSVAPDGSVDPALLEPLTGLGPCGPPPPAAAEADEVEGLVLPPTSVVTAVNDAGPLTQVRGYVERTPVEVRVWFADGSAGVEVLTIEDEVREVEVLVAGGQTRQFLKGQAVCERGSAFVAFVAPAGAAELLPEPALGGN